MGQGNGLEVAGVRRGRRTILVADPDRASRHVLGHKLGRIGYLVVLSDSGREALDLVSARGFDLVLLDAKLPGVSGMEALREIRGARDTQDLPVILMTSADDAGAGVEALAAGADDHLVRPFTIELLAARIARTLVRSTRFDALKRSNLALDARIAARAIELGEARTELAAARAELERLRRA